MPDMQTGPGRIRKHIQHIILGLRGGIVHLESMRSAPKGLPLAFYLSGIIIVHKLTFSASKLSTALKISAKVRFFNLAALHISRYAARITGAMPLPAIAAKE